MNEHVFTIFQGPNAGRRFTLAQQALMLGRGETCDVTLADERASRHHAKLLPEPDGPRLLDEGSSNGTFVNGRLVNEARLNPGDIIAIGHSSIIFGPEAPSPERLAELARSRPKIPAEEVEGEPTNVMIPKMSPPRLTEIHLRDIVEAVADAAKPSAEARGVAIFVEIEAPDDSCRSDANALYGAMAGFLSHFLGLIPPAKNSGSESRAESVLSLRLEKAGGVFKISCIAVGIPFDRAQLTPAGNASTVVRAKQTLEALGGVFQIMPADTPGAIARLTLPAQPT